MRIWPCLGWPCPPKLTRPWDGWSFYGSQDPVLPILWVTGPWVQGLFGTYITFTPIIAEQKCLYGPDWGDPVPPNCRVLKPDGRFTVARTLYYPYYELRVPGSKGYLGIYSTITPIIAEQKCVHGPVWGDPVPPNCRVLKADGRFTIAKTLYYRYYELRVPSSMGNLVHTATWQP